LGLRGRYRASEAGRAVRLTAAVLALSVFAALLSAQDERSVKSPDGQLEVRLFSALPDDAILTSLAYQVWLRGKPLIETSFLGLDILFQEPRLGDNVGLSAEKVIHEAHYNGLWADFLQTSTTGRRIQFEVRVWNDGVAFRYIVPKSALLFDLALADEATQFRFAVGGDVPEIAAVPYVREAPGIGWIGVYCQGATGFPPVELKRFDAKTLVSHLPGGVPEVTAAFRTTAPWTGPWRTIAIAADREKLGQAEAIRELTR
jgi:glycosyl hydrolase family 97